MQPKNPDQRAEKARAYADTITDDTDQDDAYEPTYRDGSLKNECWNDAAWRDN